MGHINLGERLEKTRVRLEHQQDGTAEPVAKFAQLTRKETRVREEQYAQLTSLARSLMRRRVSRRERITENTLIRVAIDLLLAQRGELRGSDENELRRSVTSGVPDFRSAEVTDSRRPEVLESRYSDVRDFRGPGVPRIRGHEGRDSGGAVHPAPEWGSV